MFDQVVEKEGLGRAEEALDAARPDGGLGNQGPSPDGLGAYVEAQPGDMYSHATSHRASTQMPQMMPQMHQVPQQSMSGEIDFLEPVDTSDGAALRSSGFTLLFVALASVAGYAWKGGHGAITGLLLSAGAANGYRAQKWWGSADPSEKHEALVSTIFAAGEIFGGLYVGYQAAKRAEK